jgi:integrase
MRGHVKKRASWEFVVDLGKRPLQRCPACRKRYWIEQERLKQCPKCSGPLEEGLERRQELHTGFKTKREAELAMAQVVGQIASGTHIQASRLLVREYLLDEWLPAIRSTIRPTTFASYESHVALYLLPAFGEMQLQDLTATHLNALYAQLLSEDRPRAGRPLAPATVRRIHATFHRALKDAVRWNKISRNPSDAADPPRAALCGESEMKIWTLAELQTFLASERDSPHYPLWLTLITTGLRRGEALGLRWQDVDLAAHTMAIRQTRVVIGYQPLLSTPKTRKGRRQVALDPATVACLGALKDRRVGELEAQGQELDEGDLIFTDTDGTPIHPKKATECFIKGSKAAGVPVIRLHDLRHTHATLALSAGVHPKIVSERLGHANIGITLDTYSHCLPVLSEEAARKVAALVVPA